jgi:hypothetical protein
MPYKYSKERTEAIQVLKNLLCCLYSIHADLFHAALIEEGFSEDRAGLLVGACIRTAASKKWITKTDLCLPSIRNHSNLQRVWISNLHHSFSQRGANSMREIRKSYAFWESKGLIPPDELAERWKKI